MKKIKVSKMIVVLVTFPDLKTARRIVRGLVKERLCTCGSMFRVSSVFIWKGKTEETAEFAALIKTVRGNYPKIERYIRDNHPYEVPEIISWPIERGWKTYLEWIGKETIKEIK